MSIIVPAGAGMSGHMTLTRCPIAWLRDHQRWHDVQRVLRAHRYRDTGALASILPPGEQLSHWALEALDVYSADLATVDRERMDRMSNRG